MYPGGALNLAGAYFRDLSYYDDKLFQFKLWYVAGASQYKCVRNKCPDERGRVDVGIFRSNYLEMGLML